MFRKVRLLLLIVAAMFVSCASAETVGFYEPGDVFNVDFTLKGNPDNAVFAEVELHYNGNALNYLEGDFNQKGVATILNINGIRVGHSLTARFQILPDAEDGLQNIALTVTEMYDRNENAVTGLVFSEYKIKILTENSTPLTAEEYNRLGIRYENGDGVEQDYSKAVYYYKLAADQGYIYAQNNLGYMYDMGYGIEQDYEKAVYYYQLSAEQGNYMSQCNLGYMYESGHGVEQNYEKAVYYYELAANQGYARGQSNLGYMYSNGYGVKQDYEKAMYYYQLAAEQGHSSAQNNMGYLYRNGYGVERSYEKAVSYFQLAAAQGYALAQSNLGEMYENGFGVQKDIGKAIEYYQLAADQGNQFAAEALKRLK